MQVPKVSVVMITYGHEPYIGKAIESVLMQETSFDIELIIANDNSPDSTDSIVKKYIGTHPKGGLIKYIYNEKNKGMIPNFISALSHAQGKYIALCEGDDYWTDPLKLQKQAVFLDNNPGYSMCCGGYISKHLGTGAEKTVILNLATRQVDDKGFTFTLEDMPKSWITKTLTSMYVKELFDVATFDRYNHFRDIHLFYYLITAGKGYYFKEVFGVYNIHPGGVNSMHQGKVNTNAAYNAYKELYVHHKNEFTRGRALKATLALFNFDMYNKYEANTSKRRIKLFKEAVKLVKKPAEIKWLLSMFIPRTLKDNLKEKN